MLSFLDRKKRREYFTGAALAAFFFVACWILAAAIELRAGGGVVQELEFALTPWAASARTASPSSNAAPAPERKEVQAALFEVTPGGVVSRRSALLLAPGPLTSVSDVESVQKSFEVAATGYSARSTASALRGPVQSRPSRIVSERRRLVTATAPVPLSRKEIPDIELHPARRRDAREEAVQVEDIIEWMRHAPSDLPPGILRHVDFRAGNLTSKANFEHHGETWELYLMARVPVREIHVVLVGEHRTYYLIDRSFQREGRAFRVGRARRTSSVITGVFSEERAASERDAARFYDLFLSWWEGQRLHR